MSAFGPEFEQIWPKAGSALKLTEFGQKLLKQCASVKRPEPRDVDMNEFKRKSSNFPLEFGTNTCRIMSQPKDRYPNIQKQISSAYPVIHERVLQLYLDFLEHKCKYGYPMEKSLYNRMSLTEFVQRLLDKRCAVFMDGHDTYLLVTGQKGIGGDDFTKIGSPLEKEPLTLSNCLSYDEMKLSAFLSVSSYTELINNGERYNAGAFAEDPTTIEREGIVVGIIGARFEKPLYMEYQDIVISAEQNTLERGYGSSCAFQSEGDTSKAHWRDLWRRFYEDQDYVYSPQLALNNPRFGKCLADSLFDNVLMKKRYALTFDTLLMETQTRAAQAYKQAYVHVVGIGLGVWKITEQQRYIFLETFAQRVRHLLPQLNNIGALHFSWFRLTKWHDLEDNGLIASQSHPLGGIRIFMSNRNPADKLKGEFANMLLVISYAWDGNALPGNEFWLGSLTGSNDPSTACSTLISELHNAHINNEWVCGENLHIASLEKGCQHIADYANIVCL